jgi:isoleucyl-tRNA synthetase
MVLAPFTPFLAEELYRQLTGGESVHLLHWPEEGKVDEDLVNDMARARQYITDGLAKRATSGIKVRQPLAKVTVPELPELYRDIIAEELNVKTVQWGLAEHEESAVLDTEITPELREEGIMRELVRLVQNARKDAGLNVEDRISLLIETDSPEIQQAVDTHMDVITSETLTQEYGDVPADAFEISAKVEGLEVKILLAKH